MGPTARASISKCLLNNVGLVKARSSFLLALSRYVFKIKHVSVSTRLTPAFITGFIASAVVMEAAFCCHQVGVMGNYIKIRFRRFSKAFFYIKHKNKTNKKYFTVFFLANSIWTTEGSLMVERVDDIVILS